MVERLRSVSGSAHTAALHFSQICVKSCQTVRYLKTACSFGDVTPENHSTCPRTTTCVCVCGIVAAAAVKYPPVQPTASTISRAVKMAASAQRGCQTVRLMADSSATVSSLREAASIFPLVPNEILITNTPLCQYFHGSPEPGASTGRLHDGILGLTYRTSGQVGCNTVNCKHAAPYFHLEMLQALGPPLCTAHSGRAAAPRRAPTDDVSAHLFLPFECVEASTQSAPQ